MVQHERLLAADTKRDLRNARESLWLLTLVLVVSAAMGIAAWLFLTSLDAVSAARTTQPLCFLFLPIVGVGTAWLYRTHGGEASRGNNLVIDSALTGKAIPARMALFTFFCSVATHLAGGSAGREGTAVQIGGTIADNVARRLHLGTRDHQDLLLSGIAAAFGGVFGTPLAGAFFGMEMCFVGKLNYSAGIYCLIASFTGDTVARALGTQHTEHMIGTIPELEPRTIALAVAAAVVFGLTARLFSRAIRTIKRFYANRITNYLVAALVGSLVVLAAFGVGTQRVEDELSMLLPADVEVIRMDADTTRAKGAHQRLLEQFDAAECAVLVGTQMIAKGLDFPEVTLVGVINADTMLKLPDFRAAERTYDLLEQVAGRAGRGGRPGEVVVQTYWASHPAMRAVAAHDRALFLESELAERAEACYPPYSRLCNVVVWGRSERDVRAATADLAAALRERVGSAPGWEVLGPADCARARAKDQVRRHVMVKAPPGADAGPVLKECVASLGRRAGINIAVDVDAYDMM